MILVFMILLEASAGAQIRAWSSREEEEEEEAVSRWFSDGSGAK